MARGWESKDVESQMEEREESRRAQEQARHCSLQEAEHQRELESIQLSRVRVLRDLETAQNPKYRDVLRLTLQHLDAKLAQCQTEAKRSTN